MKRPEAVRNPVCACSLIRMENQPGSISNNSANHVNTLQSKLRELIQSVMAQIKLLANNIIPSYPWVSLDIPFPFVNQNHPQYHSSIRSSVITTVGFVVAQLPTKQESQEILTDWVWHELGLRTRISDPCPFNLYPPVRIVYGIYPSSLIFGD